jgi:hypothetical protein
MISLAFGLTLATYASAQVVSMIPNPNMAAASGSASASGYGYASGSASASSPTSAPPAATSSSGSDYSGYSASASPNQYNQYGSSSSSPAYNQYGSSSSAYNQYTSAAAAQYTPPPQSEAMPYESFMSGGYKSMDCGYGYVKGSDGSCMSKESWVRISHLEISCAMRFIQLYSIPPRVVIRCRPRGT